MSCSIYYVLSSAFLARVALIIDTGCIVEKKKVPSPGEAVVGFELMSKQGVRKISFSLLSEGITAAPPSYHVLSNNIILQFHGKNLRFTRFSLCKDEDNSFPVKRGRE